MLFQRHSDLFENRNKNYRDQHILFEIESKKNVNKNMQHLQNQK